MPEFDDDFEEEIGVDTCQHGVGFDEECEWCEFEITGELRERKATRRTDRKKQADLFTTARKGPTEEQHMRHEETETVPAATDPAEAAAAESGFGDGADNKGTEEAGKPEEEAEGGE